jgi:dipeptidase D
MGNRVFKGFRLWAAILPGLLIASLISLAACGDSNADQTGGFDADEVYSHYSAICEIPRAGADYPEKINNYILGEARDAGLKATEDKYGNVVVEIPATEGKENEPVTILQSHTDTTIHFLPSVIFDPDEDGVNLILDKTGDISSMNMSMGADTAIGMANMLSIMNDDGAHGSIRLLFTAYGESDLGGAENIDAKYLDGDLLINLDSHKKDEVLIGSKYAEVFHCKETITSAPTGSKYSYIMAASGFGKSSVGDDSPPQVNPVNILAQVLSSAKGAGIIFELNSFTSEKQELEAPDSAIAVVTLNDYEKTKFIQIFDSTVKDFEKESPDELEKQDVRIIETIVPPTSISNEDTDKIITCLYGLTNLEFTGTKTDVPALDFTSVNISDNSMECSFVIKSSEKETLETAIEQEQGIEELSGLTFTNARTVPGITAQEDDPLLIKFADHLKNATNSKLTYITDDEVSELGYFKSKNEALTCISVGLDIRNYETELETIQLQDLPALATAISTYLSGGGNP